jgi:hypothetical protein
MPRQAALSEPTSAAREGVYACLARVTQKQGLAPEERHLNRFFTRGQRIRKRGSVVCDRKARRESHALVPLRLFHPQGALDAAADRVLPAARVAHMRRLGCAR